MSKQLMKDCADGPALGIGGPLMPGRQALQRLSRPEGGRSGAPGAEAPPAQRDRLRRGAPFRRRARSAAPTDLGVVRIGTPICEDAWHEDVTETLAETRRRDPAGPERLALLPQQIRHAHEPHGRPRGRDRTAADLPQHGRRAGRSGLRRRHFRAEPAAASWRCSLPLFDEADRACRFRCETETGWRAVQGEMRRISRRRGNRTTARWSTALARLPAARPGSEGAAGAVRRYRQRHRRHHRRRRDGPGECALRDAAVGIHLRPFARRCRRGGRGAGLPGWTPCRSQAPRDGGDGGAGGALRRARSRI